MTTTPVRTTNFPRMAILFAALLLALTTVPYLVAWGRADEGWRFSGFLFGVEDAQSYIAKMRQGAAGDLAFTLAYTTETHAAAPGVYLHYLLPGWLVGRFILSSDPALTPALIAVFHAMRLAGAVLYLWVLYRFLSAFVRTEALRLLAFMLAAAGGGLGWLLIPFGTLPPEFYLPEGFGLLSLWGIPHLLFARAALLGGLLLMMPAGEHGRWRLALGAALCWAIMGAIVPFYLAVVYAVLAAWIALVWLRARAFPARLATRALMGAGLTLPLLLYYLLQFSRNPALAEWSAQNALPSPALLPLLLAYALLLIPALTALPFVWASGFDKGRLMLLVAWPAAAFVMAYAPINVQRRLLEGVIVPLAVLASIGLMGWMRRGAGGKALAALVTSAALVSSALLLLGGLNAAQNPGVPVFRPAGEAEAFQWLNTYAPRGSVVLSSSETGNALPAFTDLRPLAGHGVETIRAGEKQALVNAFFTDALSAQAQADLLAGPCLAPEPLPCSAPVDFVLFGPLEQAVSGEEVPGAWASGMTLIYEEAGYRVYDVR